jgi:hypothetical protein
MRVDVDSLDACAERLDLGAGGSSLHGAIVGGLCADPGCGAHLGALLAEAYGTGSADGGAELRALAGAVERELRDPDYAFALKLPADEATLAERAHALAEWCDAFIALFSVSLGRLGAAPPSPQCNEILGDIGAIAGSLDPATLADGEEEDERDFQEIAEFVRLATLSIFTERAVPGDAVLH